MPPRSPRPDPAASIGRRDALLGALALALAPLPVAGCSSEALATPPKSAFVHGVASGDPLPDAVMLWTRVKGAGDEPVDVSWVVAEDPALEKRVTSGSVTTTRERDFTVKVDVLGLAAGRTYYYRFEALGDRSPVGRTRTAPSGAVDRLRFAVVSCASLAHGYFHGYRALAAQADLDGVLHLGDYIYEYGSGGYGNVRLYEPEHELLSLADYRLRHAQYKRDPDLQAAHRQHPFITIWDDHEIANDGWKDGAQNHTPDEGAWADRKAAAQRAYMEWMPIREQADGRIFRRLPFGDLAELVLLDTRYHARSAQIGGPLAPPPPANPTRTLLGDDQAAWMEGALRDSKARWKLLAQQVMVGNLIIDPGKTLANLDQWHGYPESRTRLLTFLRDSGVKDVVVLTGDIHSSWANELTFDPNDAATYDPATGRGSVAVELVTPGITSPGIPDLFLGVLNDARPKNPHVRWVDGNKRGFIVLDVTRERTQAAWHHFADITLEEPQVPAFAAAWSVRAGETRLVSEPSPASPREGAPALAP